jgi:hypothetical protein
MFSGTLLRAPRRGGLPAAEFPSVCVTRDISWGLPERNDRSALRNAAMLPCSLTVKRDANSVFVRGSRSLRAP